MAPIKPTDITIDKIRNGELKNAIPELYELKGIIENDGGHINDPVFDHTLAVATQLNKLLEEAKGAVRDYLLRKVTVHTRKGLLFLAGVLHDIGKKDTLNQAGDIISFPGHEKASAEKLKNMLSRFDLSTEEKEILTNIIRNHGFFHNALDHPEDSPESKTESFKKENSDIFLEIALLTKADILGGQLSRIDSKKFNFKIAFLNKLIRSF